MDPDLVRQQAEEEAASRVLYRRELPPDMRIEPVLPMPALTAAARQETPVAARFPGGRGHAAGGPPSAAGGRQPAAALARAGWRMAFGIAASCVLGTTVGLVGGMMLGVKLQLVPWQGALIGASAGLLLGWRLSSLALIRRRALGRMPAYAAAFRAAFMIFLIMAASMFVAPHFTASLIGPNRPPDIGAFWRGVTGGAVVALLVGAAILRQALRDASAPRR